jgi:hypothetical protein
MAQTAVAQQPVPTVSLQGIVVPQTAINPAGFFAATRRLTVRQKTFQAPAFGGSENVQILQTGILSQLIITFEGTLTVTLGGGTVATTAAWPYNLLNRVQFSANGQSNLVNASGWSLKARQFMERGDTQDRGVARGVGGASPGTARTQGTLSLVNEDWGVGSNVTAIPGAPTVYNVVLQWVVPVSFDQLYLNGAIFAQTSSTDLNLQLNIAPQAELFTTTGAATVALAGAFTVEGTLFTIPQGPDGQIMVPDLSTFHSLIETGTSQLTVGMNETRLAGQGVGRQLMRLYYRVMNGATPAPLPMNSTNFGQQGWRFGGNDTPEVFQTGRNLAARNENLFGVDFASLQGYGILDFASEHALRDSIDEGTATELRLLTEIANGVVLTNARLLYTQETMFAGAVGA